MRKFLVFIAILATNFTFSQSILHQKGEIYMYWGWNRGFYTRSDIHFEGNDYAFQLHKVQAKDRPTAFSFRDYFSPTRMTLPQYNFRLGVFLNSQYSISIGIDHMKYVVQNFQDVTITGEIDGSGTIYDGSYKMDTINLDPKFLMFEHTDGLNYENIELRRHGLIYQRGNTRFESILGAGAGILLPKTNASLLNNERHDEFHLAGFGLGLTTGIQVTFWKYFFLQFEAKGGYINMPDIRTTKYRSDKASQHFFFAQLNGVFGISFNPFLPREVKEVI